MQRSESALWRSAKFLELFCGLVLVAPSGYRRRGDIMRIGAGYEISYNCTQPTPMILALSVHPSRLPDLLAPECLHFEPHIPATEYRDVFDNICHVIYAPTCGFKISSNVVVSDSGEPDQVAPEAAQI